MHFDDIDDALLQELTVRGRQNGGASAGGCAVPVETVGCGGAERADTELVLNIPFVPLWYELIASADPELEDEQVEAFVRNDLDDQFATASAAYLDVLRGSLGVKSRRDPSWVWTSVEEIARRGEILQIRGTCRAAANQRVERTSARSTAAQS